MDLNNFGPFDSDVWGSVSDWIMILVTAVTGLLIWLTFRSQLILQKIEQRRYTKDNAPNFDMVITGFDAEIFLKTEENPSYTNRYIYNIGFKFTLQQSIARNISIQIETPSNNIWSDENMENVYNYDFLNINHSFDLGYFVQGELGFMTVNRKTYSYHSNKLIFTLTYYDDIGNKYQQVIEYFKTSLKETEPIINQPIVVKSIY